MFSDHLFTPLYATSRDFYKVLLWICFLSCLMERICVFIVLVKELPYIYIFINKDYEIIRLE
jgi:hypothetical protein